jgi:type IV pilus assembly protein PilN
MAHINLLPWREELRKERQRRFFVMLIGAVALMGAGMAFTHLFFESRIEHQDRRNQFLEREIAAVEKTIHEIKELEQTRDRLLSRMEVIQRLQQSRPLIVHLFDELVRTTPEGVHLGKLAHRGTSLTLDGIAQTNARVSAYMRQIDASEWLGQPKLAVIKRTADSEGRKPSEFQLRASQIVSKGEDEGEEAGG